jgi:hypothetical protein
VRARAASFWAALSRGAAPSADDLAALEADAQRAGSAALVVEAAALAALAALARADDARALSLARRASRMARTESLPQAEYLAHLVLARLRAREGRAHLATRILVALGRVAPPVWAGPIGLELALLGEIGEARPLLDRAAASRARTIACAIADAVHASSARDRSALSDALDRACREAARAPLSRARIEDVAAALDAARDPGRASPTVRAFIEGGAALPGDLVGLASLPRGDEAVGTPYVLARPGEVPRRVLGAGLTLVQGPLVELGADADRQHRTRRAAASLLLAGDGGLSREALFQRVYGFGFRSVTHQSVLDVLLHRARDYLGAAAEMTRDGERVRVSPTRAVAVPEAPVDRPMDDLVLRAVARRPDLSAKDLANELGVALRTVQASLKTLLEEGQCVTHKNGRVVTYRVEDTTFSEPTCLTIAT